MKFFKLFLIFFFVSLKSFATAQAPAPDYLIINNDTLRIHTNPLKEYFDKNPIPRTLIKQMSSGNWRGYVAYFKFVDNKLVVQNIYVNEYRYSENGKSENIVTSIYKDVFGENLNFECSFYSGLLICPFGRLIEYVHMGYGSLFENYKLFEIKEGVNSKSKDFTSSEYQIFKIDYFNQFKKTSEYQIKVKEYKEMMVDVNLEVDKAINLMSDEKPKKKKRINKSLQLKEAEYKADKELDSFMFIFLDDFMKTIEIPKT